MVEQQKIDEEWLEQKGVSNFWKADKIGDSITGKVHEIKQGTYGMQVTLENEAGLFTLPSHKVLQNRLQDCKVGDFVKVIYEKEELPKVRGQNATRIYKVLKKKSE